MPAITLDDIYKEVVKQNMYYESINSKLDMLSLQIKKQEVSKEYSIEDFNEIIQYIPLNSVDMLNSIEQKINDDSGLFNTKMVKLYVKNIINHSLLIIISINFTIIMSAFGYFIHVESLYKCYWRNMF